MILSIGIAQLDAEKVEELAYWIEAEIWVVTMTDRRKSQYIPKEGQLEVLKGTFPSRMISAWTNLGQQQVIVFEPSLHAKKIKEAMKSDDLLFKVQVLPKGGKW